MSCTTCYNAEISKCPEVISIQAGLTPNTDYYIRVTDKFGNRYGEAITSNGDGDVAITADDTDVYPVGLFDDTGSVLLIEVSVENNPWVPLTMTLGATEQTCIQLTCVTDNLGNTIIK